MNYSRLRKENILTFLNILPFLWLFSGLILIPNGQTFLPYFLVIATIANISIKSQKPRSIDNIPLIYPILIYISSITISYLFNGELWPTLRSSLYVFFFLMTTRFRYNDINATLKYLVPVASLSIAFMFFWEHLSSDSRFVKFAGLNPIPLATIIVLYISYNLSMIVNQRDIVKNSIALVANCYSIIMTETRTAYICVAALLLISLLLFAFSSKLPRKKLVLLISALTLTSLAFSWFDLMPNNITKRYNAVKYEISEIRKGNFLTSIGQRIQFLNVSYQVISDNHFVLPYSKQQFSEEIEKNKFASAFAERNDNGQFHISIHNQFLHSWMVSGITGLVAVVILLVLPAHYSIRRWGIKRSALVVFAAFTMFLSCLTDNMLSHIAVLQCYLLMTALGLLFGEVKNNES